MRVPVEYGRVLLRAREAAREFGAMREGDLAVFGLDEADLPVNLHVREFSRGDVVDRVSVPLVVAENDVHGPLERGEPVDDEGGDEIPAVEEHRDAERVDFDNRRLEILEVIVRIADNGHFHRSSSLSRRGRAPAARTE